MKKQNNRQFYEISLGREARQVIVQHGEKTFPLECCGFLYGHEKNGRHITQAIPAANSQKGDQRRRFEIAPADYLKAERYALDNGLQLLGIYHSHPDHPAIASRHDLAVAMPWFSYIIVSVVKGKAADLKSWRLEESNEKKFIEETIRGEAPRQTKMEKPGALFH